MTYLFDLFIDIFNYINGSFILTLMTYFDFNNLFIKVFDFNGFNFNDLFIKILTLFYDLFIKVSTQLK